jgi:hypothetical protein
MTAESSPGLWIDDTAVSGDFDDDSSHNLIAVFEIDDYTSFLCDSDNDDDIDECFIFYIFSQ